MFSNVNISIMYILMALFALSAMLMLTDQSKAFDFKVCNVKNSIFICFEFQFAMISTIFLIYRALNGGGHFYLAIYCVVYFLSLANFAMVLHKYKKMTHGAILPAVLAIIFVFVLMIPLFFAASHV